MVFSYSYVDANPSWSLRLSCQFFSQPTCSSLSGSDHFNIREINPTNCKASHCGVNFSFFLSSFYYRSSSWRLYMMVRQGFISVFNCSSRVLSKLRSAKLYSKINMVLNTCFVLRSSSILHLASEVQFVLPYLLWLCYITLDNLLHFSWFTCFQEWGILNPSIFCWSYLVLDFT